MTDFTNPKFDDPPIIKETALYGNISIWRETRNLGVYTARGFHNGEARWGHGVIPEDAVVDLLRELTLVNVESHDEADTATRTPNVTLYGHAGAMGLDTSMVPAVWQEAYKGMMRPPSLATPLGRPVDWITPLPAEFFEHLRAGEKIKAIKEYRNTRGVGLAEARDIVKQIIADKEAARARALEVNHDFSPSLAAEGTVIRIMIMAPHTYQKIDGDWRVAGASSKRTSSQMQRYVKAYGAQVLYAP
jgi:hypothetical protein